MPHRTSQILWVAENNSECGAREVIAGVTAPSKPDIIVALQRIDGAQRSTAGRIEYKPGSISKSPAVGGRALLALQLIRKVRPQKGVIVSGTSYGSDRHFTDALPSTGLDFVIQLRPGAIVSPQSRSAESHLRPRYLAPRKLRDRPLSPDSTKGELAKHHRNDD